MSEKQISSKDPDRADHRMISYIMRVHFKNKGKLNDKSYALINKVFKKAGGSWVKVFQGSSEDLDTIKKILKIGMKRGLIKKK